MKTNRIFILLPILLVIAGLYIGYMFTDGFARTVSNEMTELPYTRFFIQQGNVYTVMNDGKESILINKKDLKHESLTIRKIEVIELSPDKEKILIYANGDISALLLYVKDLRTGDIQYVSYGDEAVWSPDSRYIAYTKRPADVGPLNIFVYDTHKHLFVETEQAQNKIKTSYTNLQWSPDSTYISVNYETYSDVPYGNIVANGQTKVLLKTTSP